MSWDLAQTLPLTLAQTADVVPEATPAAPAGAETPAADGSVDAGGVNGGTPIDAPKQGPLGGMWMIFLLVLVVMWIFLLGGQRKEKKKRASLLAAIKKGDKVQTVGGILGTIVEVRDDRVIVKIDENSNTRVPFARSAIQNVISEDDSEQSK